MLPDLTLLSVATFKPLIKIIAIVLMGLGLHFLLFFIGRRLSGKKSSIVNDLLLKHIKGPARVFIPLIMLLSFMQPIELPENLFDTANRTLVALTIAALAWILIRLTQFTSDLILSRFKVDDSDNLRARQVHTQLRMLEKIVIFVICVLSFATLLMSFPRARQLGTSILASAGIIGLTIGFAAQRSISTLIAGLQIAFTQPIRIDDVLVVENEWGRVEEVTLTYVVLRIWDMRRLILPINYFLEKPFQNWTRVSARMLGTVFIYVDYTVPVDAVRAELRRILEANPHWDGDVCGLQVTDTTQKTVELRALMSAADSGAAWDLRCYVRERLITFLQTRYPHALPRVRAEWPDSAGAAIASE